MAYLRREVLGKIVDLYRKNPEEGEAAYAQYKQYEKDPSSSFYRPYSQPTSSAVSNLAALGFDTANLNNGWLGDNNTQAWIESNLSYDPATGKTIEPAMNATKDQKTAYWLDRYSANESLTRQAEQEMEQAKKEARYWADRKDLNLSDEQILNKVRGANFENKFPTLAKMENSGDKPLELNRAVDWNGDVLPGEIWKARNPDYNGEEDGALIRSYLNEGNTWQYDPEIAGKLDSRYDTYSPYEVGPCGDKVEKALVYFNVPNFTREWIEQNADRINNSDDEEAKRQLRVAEQAVAETEKLNNELTAMRAEIDEKIASNLTADAIINSIKQNTEAYGGLFALDNSMESGVLVNTADKIPYRWADMEAEIRRKADERFALPNTSEVVTKLMNGHTAGSNMTGEQLAKSYESPVFDTVDTEVDNAFQRDMSNAMPTIIANGTQAEKTAGITGASLLQDKGIQYLQNRTGDFSSMFKGAAMDRVRTSYVSNSSVIHDYETHSTSLEEMRRRLEEIEPLYDLYGRTTGIGTLSPEEKENIEFEVVTGSSHGYVLQCVDLLNDEESDPDRRLDAADTIYRRVTMTSPEEAGETDESMMQKVMSWMPYINSRLSGDAEGNGAKYLELNTQVEALRGDIAKEEEYLGGIQAQYDQAKSENDFTIAAYSAMQDNNDPTLFLRLDNVIQATRVGGSPLYYNPFDTDVANGKMTKEEMISVASQDAQDVPLYVNMLKAEYDRLKKQGYKFTAEDDKNFNAYVSSLESYATFAEYNMLDGAEDFDEVVADTRKKIQSGEMPFNFYDMADLAASGYGEDKGILRKIEKGINILYPQIALYGNAKDMLNNVEILGSLEVMSQEEWDRLFYLYGKEGKDAAQKYLNLLMDPDYGIVTVRVNQKVNETFDDLTQSAPVAGYVLARAAGLASTPLSVQNRVDHFLRGKQVSPFNSAYLPLQIKNISDQNARNAFVEACGGKDSTWGAIGGGAFDIGTSLLDFFLQRKALFGSEKAASAGKMVQGVQEAAKASGLAKVGSAIVKNAPIAFYMSMTSAAQKEYSVLSQTGDADAALKAGVVDFATGMVTHSVFAAGTNGAYNAGKLGNFFKRMVATDFITAGTSLLARSTDEFVAKATMGEKSNWQKDYDAALEKTGSKTLAKQEADKKSWDRVANGVVSDVVNATFRQIATYTYSSAKEGIKNTIKTINDFAKKEFSPKHYIKDDNGNPVALEDLDPEAFKVKASGYKDGYIVDETGLRVTKLPEGFVPNQLGETEMINRANGLPFKAIGYVVDPNTGTMSFVTSEGALVPYGAVAQNYNDTTINREGFSIDREYGLLYEAGQYYKGWARSYNENAPALLTGEIPSNTQTSGRPAEGTSLLALPGGTPADPQAAKDATTIMGMRDSSPTAAATCVSSMINLPALPGADKAVGQKLVGEVAKGDPNVASMALIQMNRQQGLHTWEEVKGAVATATLTDGEGNAALVGIFDKVREGQPVTEEDVTGLIEGANSDMADDAFQKMMEDAVTENRIANLTAQIIASPENLAKLNGAQQAADDAARSAEQAKGFMEQKQSEAEAAGESLKDAEAQYNPANEETGGPLQQQTLRLLGADTARQQAEAAYAVQQQKAQQANAELEQKRTDVMTEARKEAGTQVNQEMAMEQAERISQEQAAANAEQERRDMMVQDAAAEDTRRLEFENRAKEILAKRGLTGEYMEQNAKRMADIMEQRERGKLDTTQPLGSVQDAETLLRTMSRKTGISVSMEDLGDPLIVRERIDNKNNLILNSRLQTADALIGAAMHGFTHGLEEMSAYSSYSDVAVRYLYGGRGTDLYNREIAKKKQDYASQGVQLDNAGAERELVAEFTRLHLADRKFVRKAVSRGVGTDVRKNLTASLGNLQGYRFQGAAKRQVKTLQKAERLFQEAMDERARAVKEGYKGHTGISQFSITSAINGAGLTVETTDDNAYKYKLIDKSGNEIAPGEFTPEMLAGSPIDRVISLYEQNSKEPGKAQSAAQMRKFYSDMVNMIGKYQDAATVWELAGNLAFSTIKTNSDKQYGTSADMGSICTKVQAILNVISDTQLKLGRVLTKDEIDGVVYEEVGKGVQDENGNWKHGATPCPPCYVYATWVNKPARLGLIKQYQDECSGWTNEQITEFMNSPAPEGKTATETKALTTAQNSKKLWIKLCLADEHKDKATGQSTWTRKSNPSICPDDVLLDLRRSGDMAVQYPGTWNFMQKGGNAQGKAISPYADARVGEFIMGRAVGADKLNKLLLADAQKMARDPDYIPKYLNPFLVGADAPDAEKAQKLSSQYYKKAVKNVKKQNVMGGQRWQSWSDFRAEWGSDYLMEMMTMQALGAKVQTYTKVAEAMDLFASAGFEVNMSLMPDGDGFEHNEDGSIKLDDNGRKVLKFSGVTGMDPEEAKAYERKYGEKGNVQPMVVGISDEHIIAALASDDVFFCIPFHGSGGSVRRLQHLMNALGQQMKTGFDYTNCQTDSFIEYEEVGSGKNKRQVNTNPYWKIREAILTGKGESLSAEQKALVDDNEYLSKLYSDRYENESSDAYHVYFSKNEAQQIFPYEYWQTDPSKEGGTLATANVNGERFIEYCQLLGVVPRFSGVVKKAEDGKFFTPEEYVAARPESIVRDENGNVIQFEYGNFSGIQRDENGNITGYDPVDGYWKLLIDRPMYSRIYEEGKLNREKSEYREPKAVNTGNITIQAVPKTSGNKTGHSTEESEEIAARSVARILGPATGAYMGDMTMGNTPSEVDEEIVPTIKNAMYAGGDEEQLSAGGELSDAELMSLMADNGMIPKEEVEYSYIPGVLENAGGAAGDVPGVPGTDADRPVKQRQFGSQTVQGSGVVTQGTQDYLKAHSDYYPDTNAEQIDRAREWIRSQATENDPDGYISALRQVTDPNYNYLSVDGQVRMLAVADMIADRIRNSEGEARQRAIEDEQALYDMFNQRGTNPGQILQARKIFLTMTPIGRRTAIKRMEDKMNDNLADMGKKYRVHLPDEFYTAVEMADPEDFDALRKQAMYVLNDQLPVTLWDKVVAWRMFCMLSSPKTHIRNVGGNAINIPVVATKNKVGAAMEVFGQAFKLIDKSERTKSLRPFAPKAIREFTRSHVKDVESALRDSPKSKDGSNGKYDKTIWGRGKGILSRTLGRGMQKAYEFVGDALSWEDWIFEKGHFERAFNGFMMARGLKPEDMKGKVLAEADAYAIKEAKKATYNDESAVADALNRIGMGSKHSDNSNGLAFLQFVVNSRMPFKRTPINIGKRAIEYSPAGIAKTFADIRHLKEYLDATNGKLEKMPKKAISPTEWIDRFSAGLTGTGIMALGFLSAVLGIARAGFGDSVEDELAKLRGEKEYSIYPGRLGIVKGINKAVTAIGKNFDENFEFELFGENVGKTMDWAAPVSLYYFTGVAFEEAVKEKGFSLDKTLSLVKEILDPMLNLSFMSGISDMLNNSDYSGNDALGIFFDKTIINFVTSLIPTWSGQLANAIEGSHTTYIEPGQDLILGDREITKGVQRIGNKIPWVNFGGIPYTNALGEEPKELLNPYYQQLISPSNNFELDMSPEMVEISRLISARKDVSDDIAKVLPKEPEKTITVNGEKIPLTGKEFTQLKDYYGETWRETARSLVEHTLYQYASDDSKEQMLILAKDYAKQVAKYKMNDGFKMDTWVASAYKNGNATDVITDMVAETNKTWYTEHRTTDFIRALYDGDEENLQSAASELEYIHADASKVRSAMVDYFKPMYQQAYKDGDTGTMERIEYTLTHIDEYIKLDKKITAFTDKTFSGWITTKEAKEYAYDDEDKWLGYDTGTDSFLNDGVGDAETDIRPPQRPESDSEWDEYMDDLNEFWANHDFDRSDPVGQYGLGNIDLNNRQVVQNDDGSISTEIAFSFYDDESGKEVLIPMVVNGQIVSEDEAIEHYYETGEYLGMFDDWHDADDYAMMLHNRQAWYYNR